MKNLSKIMAVSVIFLFLGFVPCLHAQDYYVDFDGGSDENDGTTPDKPFKHCPGDEAQVGKAAALKPAPGDNVIFKGGVYYRGSFTLTSGGEAGKPLTLDGNTAGNFGKGRAIIDGSEILSGWKKCDSSDDAGGNPNWRKIIWTEAPKDTKPMSWNLCEGDQLLYLAQQPNPKDPFWADDLESYFKIQSSKCTKNSVADKRFDDYGGEALVGGQLLFYGKPNWLAVCDVTGYDPASKKLTFSTGDKIEGLYDETKYALLNHVRLIDKPGEYCFDNKNGKIFIWPLTEGEIDKKIFTISTRKIGIDLNGKSYVTIQGFRIQKQCAGMGEQGGTAIRSMGPATNVVIRDNEITMVRSIPRQGTIGLTKCSKSLIEKNRLWENPFYRIIVLDEFNDSVIRDNILDKNGGTGLLFYRTHRAKILNNTIRRHLSVHAQGIAVYAKCSDILIEGNISFDRTALTLQDGENFMIRNNIFHGGGGPSIAMWGGDPLKNISILNNVLTGASTNKDDWARDLSIFSNNSLPGSSFIIRNNILDGIELEGAGARHKIDHNLFTRKGDLKIQKDNIVEPNSSRIFIDPGKYDYRLKPGSPAINAGADVNPLYPKQSFPDFDFQKDYGGRPRVTGRTIDIGAFSAGN